MNSSGASRCTFCRRVSTAFGIYGLLAGAGRKASVARARALLAIRL
jgi:hypothetical protein